MSAAPSVLTAADVLLSSSETVCVAVEGAFIRDTGVSVILRHSKISKASETCIRFLAENRIEWGLDLALVRFFFRNFERKTSRKKWFWRLNIEFFLIQVSNGTSERP